MDPHGSEGRALVLAAHGSRRDASNEEVRRLTERIRARAAPRYRAVELGFIELAEPSLAEAIDRAVAQGAREVVVVPYFLAAGRHVSEDVPEVVRDRQGAHPGVRLTITRHLGATDALAELLLAIAGGAPGPDPVGHAC